MMKTLEHHRLAELLLEARSGNSDAFNEIYDYTSKIQYFQIRQIVNDAAEAEDALQETYLTLYKNMDKIDPPTALIAYLNRISYYVSKNMKRSANLRNQFMTPIEDEAERLPGDIPSPSERLETEDTARSIRKSLDRMDERERLVLIMHYYQNLTIKQISYSMGISIATVKRIHASAKKHLKSSLERQGLFGWTAVLPKLCQSIEGELAVPHNPGRNVNPNHTVGANGTAGSGCASAAGSAAAAKAATSLTGKLALSTAAKCSIAAILTGTLITGVSLMGLPQIENVELPQTWQTSSASVEITVKNGGAVRSALLLDSSGKAAAKFTRGALASTDSSSDTAPQSADNWHTQISKNGDYVIVLTDSMKRTTKKTIRVNCIDTTPPSAEVVSIEGGLTILHLTDNETGINFTNVYCLTPDGARLYPEHTDEPAGEVAFRLPAKDITLHYEDNAANTKQAMLRYHQPD